MSDEPYNPLAKANLAKSIEQEILSKEVIPLSAVDKIVGAGVYALYYVGEFPPYRALSEANADGRFTKPIYVGKAIPQGGRKGGLGKDSSKGTALRSRLRAHARSIAETTTINVAEFHVRYLVVDDVWIPLGENALIETFKPLWNQVLDGFGNNIAGVGREGQVKSPWDTLHPGRRRASKHLDSPYAELFRKRAEEHLDDLPLTPLPKVLREQLEKSREQIEESADEEEN